MEKNIQENQEKNNDFINKVTEMSKNSQELSKLIVTYVNCFPSSWVNNVSYHWQIKSETRFFPIFGIALKPTKYWSQRKINKVKNYLNKSFIIREETQILHPLQDKEDCILQDLGLHLSLHTDDKIVLTVLLLVRTKSGLGEYLAFDKQQCNIGHFKREFLFPLYFQQPKNFIIHTRKRKHLQ